MRTCNAAVDGGVGILTCARYFSGFGGQGAAFGSERGYQLRVSGVREERICFLSIFFRRGAVEQFLSRSKKIN